MIALTFDDGPGPSTLRILDALRAHGVLATFFVLGRNIVENPWTDAPGIGRAIVRQAVVDGHTIGNHTFTHALQQPEMDFLRELRATDAAIDEIRVEADAPVRIPPFRLPFGILRKDQRLRFCGALGRPHVHWSKNFDDWHEGPIARLLPEMLAYVDERERHGLDSVLDLHDSGIGDADGYGYDRSATADAVARFLEESVERGWHFFTVPR
jgi:peptidoglycan/xylan/chitin deacetylase (PgdA/CDA1 family)